MSGKEVRPRVTEEEHRLIKFIRKNKIDPRGITAGAITGEAAEKIKEIGGDPTGMKRYWYKGKHFSIEVAANKFDVESFTYELLENIKGHEPSYRPIDYKPVERPHCLVIDPADIHIGKLAEVSETGDKYSSEIAVQRVLEGIDGILRYAAGFEIDKIVLIVGNDVMHVDNASSTTTRGTIQDSDRRWHQIFMIAKEMYVSVIEKLRTYAPVHVIHNPSNHDWHSGWSLAQVLAAWFVNDVNISFDTGIENRKYYTYGQSLIATTHGDKAKETDLPMLMAVEAKSSWVDCKYKYWYLHHIHHKKAIKYVSVNDALGVTLEYVRSPSGSDAWHSEQGYVGAPKSIEAFVHSMENGQVARLSYNF